jgi:hypothetical protein
VKLVTLVEFFTAITERERFGLRAREQGFQNAPFTAAAALQSAPKLFGELSG